MADSDLLFGADDQLDATEPEQQAGFGHKWRILIVDDEEQVHKVTSLVLGQCEFDGSPVHLAHAYSMKEAVEMMQRDEPYALALVDVVMETDDAGLRLVRHIREELHDDKIRLVLRTGQPGQAPEETVIAKYDINDYKNKTELTSTKLKTLLYSTLRSYRDILTITEYRQGLYNLIEATSKIVDTDKLPIFASAVLEEIGTLLNLDTHAVCAHTHAIDAVAAQTHHHQYAILAATGDIKKHLEETHELPSEVVHFFDRAKTDHKGLYEDHVYVGYYHTEAAGENLLYVKPKAPLERIGSRLLDMYTRCVAITHNNLQQKEMIRRSRQEMVYVLSETIERRRPDESNHVRRVSHMAYLLAQKVGLPNSMCERIKLAAPLHDIGTIGLNDEILMKSGKYSAEDIQQMQQHAEIGASIFSNSKRPILKMASLVAAQHHEHWDGSGYPNQLKHEDIHIAARIVAIVDVIDSLGSHRSYRPAFSLDEIEQHIKDRQGTQFDSRLVEKALELLEEFHKIRLQYPDAE